MAKYDYNLVVIGAGSGGLVTAYIAAAINAKVALIERHKMGGDCLNTGCVPSKALIKSAKILSLAKRAKEFGLKSGNFEFDFSEVMDRVHATIAKIEPHDSVERYTKLGVECHIGEAKILDPHTVEVNGQKLTTKNIVIATGARPFVPPIKGLEGSNYFTSDTIWNLRELPKKLVVVGGGPIGSELTQCFARFGSEVTQVESNKTILAKEDPDAVEVVANTFKKEGINMLTEHRAERIENNELIVSNSSGEKGLAFDALLLAIGRKANVTGFGLEELSVEIRENGTINVDPYLRTNYKNIYAVGDVTGPFQFTHFSAHQAWYASINALLSPFKAFKADYSVIPWCTFTDPEVAHVGLNERMAKERGIEVEVTKYDLDDLDRAIADSEDYGFVKVLTPPGKDKILGATIVGHHAGDLLAEYVLAMRWGLGLNKILSTIHIYPTLAEANKYAAGNWKKANKPEWALNLVEKFNKLRRIF